MKRVKENYAGEVSENSGFKKVRFFNGIENGEVSERAQGEEERIFAENELVDSAEIERNNGVLGSEVSGVLSSNLGVTKEAADSESGINFHVISGNEGRKRGLDFDLNVIDIVSSDSDGEVELVSFQNDSKPWGKRIESSVPCEISEYLFLGLEPNKMGYFVGESSSGVENRYVLEEKGMTSMDNLWLSSESFRPIDINMWPESEIPRVSEPRKYFEFIELHPTALSTVPELEELELRTRELSPILELKELELRSREQALLHRMEETKLNLRKIASQFARVVGPGKNSVPSGQEAKSGTSGLGNSSGPFSEALQLIKKRTSKGAAQDLIKWLPSEENWDHSITAPLVPSLLDLSLKALSENADRIVSLELVPDMLRKRLSDLLCDTNRMSVHFLNLLLKGYPTELRIKNCSWLTEKQFQEAFGNCQTKNIRVLQLDLCGQCMHDFAFKDILSQSSSNFSSLAIISLRGACRLTDNGVKELVTAAPSLRSINLGQCALLTSDGISFIAEFLGSNLTEIFMDDCQKINAMLILPALKKCRRLEVLSVAEIQTVTDQFIGEFVSSCGGSIKELDLSNCLELTDRSLKDIGSSCVDLRSLNISNLHKLTDMGIGFLADGCRSIQKLKLFRNGFSDEAMASFLECSGESLTELSLNNVTKVGPNTAFSLAKRSKKLLHLDISWCRKITNEALGLIVDSCLSLKLLQVFGCRQITRVFINGHSNPLVRIIGVNLTPVLDHMNLLESHEVLLRYSPLPVCTETTR